MGPMETHALGLDRSRGWQAQLLPTLRFLEQLFWMDLHGPTASPEDARAVANHFLGLAHAAGIPLTNLALQKLVYFAHGLMLSRHGRPLVDGYFEAWDYGPVHPLLYGAFKGSGRDPISQPAVRRDLRTGDVSPVSSSLRPEATDVVSEIFAKLGRQPAGRLVTLSHAVGGPWEKVVNKNGTLTGLGLRISDTLISERFHRHLVAVGSPKERIGDAVVESPPA